LGLVAILKDFLFFRREDEIGYDNLQDLEVPSDLPEKFKKMDEDFINDS